MNDNFIFLYSDRLSAIDNMILDNFLCESLTGNYLRIYRWLNKTVSLGLKNKIDIVDFEFLKQNNIDVVKRPTGGGALLHSDDLCFSIIESSNKYPKENYSYIKAKIAVLLETLGIYIDSGKKTDTKYSELCFNRINRHEISVNSKKIVGISQKLYRGKYLMQGSFSMQKCCVDYAKIFTDIEVKENSIGYLTELTAISALKIRENIIKGFRDFFNINEVISDKEITSNSEFLRYKEKHKERFCFP
jgi:lipoyl(octanoyl) transferase